MNTNFDLQNAEFDAVDTLAKKWQRLQRVPIVDDDYPEARFEYEQAIRSLIEALKANGLERRFA